MFVLVGIKIELNWNWIKLNCTYHYAKERTIFDAFGTIEDVMEFSERRNFVLRGEY